MARSFYKEKGLGSRPACAICVGAGEGERAPLHLPCGVSVWLCAAHRSVAFQTRRAGRDLEASLFHVWRSSGCLTASRARALSIHRARLSSGMPVREAPGSYSWPALRREAEAAFAAGEPPGAVIDRLRRREARGSAIPPSARTMRRWFREGRWFGDPPGNVSGGPPRPAPGPASAEGEGEGPHTGGELDADPALPGAGSSRSR